MIELKFENCPYTKNEIYLGIELYEDTGGAYVIIKSPEGNTMRAKLSYDELKIALVVLERAEALKEYRISEC